MKGKQFGFAGLELLPTRWGRGPHFVMLDEGAAGSAGNGDAGSGAADTAQNSDAGQQPAGKTFSQADVDRIVKERLEREKGVREKAELKAKADAEADALKKNQEWQALAEKHAARVAELEPQSEQVTRYKGALEKYLEAEKKDLPKHVLVLLEKLDPVDQIEYIAANRAELGKPATNSTEGVPPSPNPKQKTLSEDDLANARRGQAQIYHQF